VNLRGGAQNFRRRAIALRHVRYDASHNIGKLETRRCDGAAKPV